MQLQILLRAEDEAGAAGDRAVERRRARCRLARLRRAALKAAMTAAAADRSRVLIIVRLRKSGVGRRLNPRRRTIVPDRDRVARLRSDLSRRGCGQARRWPAGSWGRAPWPGRRTWRPRLVAAPLVDQRLVGPALGDVVVELDRHVEVGEGVVLVVQRQIGEAAAVIGFGRVRRQRDRGREILDREGVLALRLVDQAAIVVGAGVGGVELDRLLEIVEGVLGAPGLAVEVAAADIGGVVVGVDLDGAVVVGERLGLVADEAVDQRAVRIGLVEIRVELDRLVEVLQRLAILAGAAIGRAAHIVGFGVAAGCGR